MFPTNYKLQTTNYSSGASLIDTIVGAALMLVVFLGIVAAFRLSVEIVTNNKARAGAIAMANERMEYLRSLPYEALGTVDGIPSGTVAQEELVEWNSVAYTRRTFIAYVDDPRDGTGVLDENDITVDYKIARVEVAWTPRKGGERSIVLVSRFQTLNGLEQNVAGGTLTIEVVDASALPVSNASVRIENPDALPQVDITTETDAGGVVTFPGATTTGSYRITVTKPGYSSTQTYDSDAGNPSPSPGHLTVEEEQTTTGTFAIDLLSTLTVATRLFDTGVQVAAIPFTLTGAKVIGTAPVIPKYSELLSVGGTGTTTTADLEYDTYTMSMDLGTGYDIAAACPPQPVYLAPNTSTTTVLFLATHTLNSLPVVVRAPDGSLLNGANVRLYNAEYDETETTSECGAAFFSGLAADTYNLDVDADGYDSKTFEDITIENTMPVYFAALE